ncbi:hypothetical protein RJ639_035770 [Escallonia herrerae]|uniref:non-specific serine/threonine protein kinase n=1 Tax=Escallonia herrerae TaxID=1293975 RepID=A0AA89BG63_9ASTE|nr:hypothetical protein RJ639_035770 [Escallonia herrerae]
MSSSFISSSALLALLWVTAEVILVSASTSPMEAEALLSSGWWGKRITVDNSLSHCVWYGITCNEAKSVIGIDLGYPCLLGSGAELGNLNFCSFPNLRVLDLSGCGIKGSIPNQIGILPLSLANLTQLTSLGVSDNHIRGSIPTEIGYLKHLTFLDLSFNNFSGRIPSSIGSLTSLDGLDLSQNYLIGPIPVELVKVCEFFDHLGLGKNNLTGTIAPELLHISYLDVSDNKFIVCPNSSIDLSGNAFEVPLGCSHASKENKRNKLMHSFLIFLLIFLIFLLITILLTFLVLGCMIIFRDKARSNQSEEAKDTRNGDICSIWDCDGRVAYEDIVKATIDFDMKYCIGTGGYGSVYKAELPCGKVVALKKLHRLEAAEPTFDKSFKNEVKMISNIRHRNIVKLYGHCLHN